jgi:hypothetical protein
LHDRNRQYGAITTTIIPLRVDMGNKMLVLRASPAVACGAETAMPAARACAPPARRVRRSP